MSRDWDVGKCRDLWAEVLIQAVDEACGRIAANQVTLTPGVRGWIVSEAQAWFERSETGVGGFLWVCDALDMDPAPIRRFVSVRASGVNPEIYGSGNNRIVSCRRFRRAAKGPDTSMSARGPACGLM